MNYQDDGIGAKIYNPNVNLEWYPNIDLSIEITKPITKVKTISYNDFKIIQNRRERKYNSEYCKELTDKEYEELKEYMEQFELNN